MRAKELQPGRQGHLFQIVVASKVHGAGQALAVCHVNGEPWMARMAITAIRDPIGSFMILAGHDMSRPGQSQYTSVPNSANQCWPSSSRSIREPAM